MRIRKIWAPVICASLIGACALIGSPVAADETAGPIGAWDLTLQTQQGDRPSWVKLFRKGEEAAAEFVGATGGKHAAHNVAIDGDTFQWTVGDSTYAAKLEGETVSGTRVRGDRRTTFTGRRVIRQVKLAGTWDVTIEIADRQLKRVLKLEQHGNEVTGSYRGDEIADQTLKQGNLEGNKLDFTIEFETDGAQFVVDYELTSSGDRLDGVLAVRDTDYEGDFKATRRRQWGRPVALFNGKDLSNWDFQKIGGNNQWQAVDGVMVNQDNGWNIFSQQRFKDYKLQVDVKVPPHGNSGIYLNGRYEVQVEDGYGKPASEGSIGAIYGRAVPTDNPSRPANEWQTFEIVFVDYWATVVLNGTTIIDNVLIEGITGGALDSNESEPGPLMLQGDHGHIEYRNIVLTPLVR